MNILFIAGFSPIVADPALSQAFYTQGLGVSFETRQGDYVYTESFTGAKHFG